MRNALKKVRVAVLSVLFVLLFTSQVFAVYTKVGEAASKSFVKSSYKGTVHIFAGDSRTMHLTDGSIGSLRNNCAFAWVNGGSVARIDKNGSLTSHLDKLIKKYRKRCVVVLNFGVNGNGDPKSNAKRLINIYKSWMKKYPDVKFYVESINPTSKKTTAYKNANVIATNKILKKEFGSKYVDMYSYLISKKLVNTSNGNGTRDGLHYKANVYKTIIKRAKALTK